MVLANLNDEQLTEIESYGLVAIRGRHYDSDALAVAKAVAEISAFGIGARHLRAFKTAVGRFQEASCKDHKFWRAGSSLGGKLNFRLLTRSDRWRICGN